MASTLMSMLWGLNNRLSNSVPGTQYTFNRRLPLVDFNCVIAITLLFVVVRTLVRIGGSPPRSSRAQGLWPFTTLTSRPWRWGVCLGFQTSVLWFSSDTFIRKDGGLSKLRAIYLIQRRELHMSLDISQRERLYFKSCFLLYEAGSSLVFHGKDCFGIILSCSSGQSVLRVEEAWNVRNNPGFGSHKIWIWFPLWPFISYMTLGKLLTINPQFPHLRRTKPKRASYLPHLLWDN